jgi:hypothetical protein
VSSFRREPGAVVETDRLFLEEILPETSPRMILGTEVEDIRRTVIFWGRACRLDFELAYTILILKCCSASALFIYVTCL